MSAPRWLVSIVISLLVATKVLGLSSSRCSFGCKKPVILSHRIGITSNRLNSRTNGFNSCGTRRSESPLSPLHDASLPDLINPSYDFAAGSAVLGTLFGGLENFKGKLGKVFGAGAIVFTLFGAFLAFQTTTLRFQFDDTNFALVKADRSQLGDNVVVGGENSWRYDSFVNYDFLPSESFPLLVYFKEVQTPVSSRVEVPIVVDNLEGQGHFFPVIANSQELAANFKLHGCAKLPK